MPGARKGKPVYIRYKGFKENMVLNIPYLRTKGITISGHGSVFTVPEDDDYKRLLEENKGAFELTKMMEECPYCDRIMQTNHGLLTHIRMVHPDRKLPEGPETRQQKTKKYAAKRPRKTKARKAL